MDLFKSSLISQLERTDSIKQSLFSKLEETDNLRQSVLTHKDSLVLSASGITSKLRDNVSSGLSNIVSETVPLGLKDHISQIATDTNSFLSASGITSREPSTGNLNSTGGENGVGTDYEDSCGDSAGSGTEAHKVSFIFV